MAQPNQIACPKGRGKGGRRKSPTSSPPKTQEHECLEQVNFQDLNKTNTRGPKFPNQKNIMPNNSTKNYSSATVLIVSEGAAIRQTNYWSSDFAKAGVLVVSHHIDFRILLPDGLRNAVREMATGKEVIISRGRWPGKYEDGLEMMFDNHSEEPFFIISDTGRATSLPIPGEDFKVTVWTRGKDNQAACQLTLPGYYRHVPILPCRKPRSLQQGLPHLN